jgi:hypothetical protein
MKRTKHRNDAKDGRLRHVIDNYRYPCRCEACRGSAGKRRGLAALSMREKTRLAAYCRAGRVEGYET